MHPPITRRHALRMGAWLVAGFCAACASDPDPETSGPDGAAPPAGDDPPSTGPTPDTTSPSPPPTDGAGGDGMGDPGGGGEPADPPATDGGEAEPPPPTPDPHVAPGAFGPELLGSSTGTALVVEVMAQPGATPRSGTLDHVRTALQAASGKQIREQSVALPDGGRDWDDAAVRALADQHARAAHGGGQVVMRLLFLHGTYQGDRGVLGVAVRGDVAAVFVDGVEAAGGPVLGFNVATVEKAVTTHEVGHLLGLVDLVLDTGRDDPDHPGHSTNQESVMFWAVESGLLDGVLTGGPPTDFDDADRRDLDRIRQLGS